jgi:two-component system NtrC family sensor kinase
VLVKKQAQHSKVVIRMALDPKLPQVQLDPDQIRQVLLNIVLNGIQAMPMGGRLEIMTTMSKNDDHVVIEVADAGPGMNEDELDYIFDPFFTTKTQGTGLGLSISYQLVKNHGGTITARKNFKKGLTFRVELPLGTAVAGDVNNGTFGAQGDGSTLQTAVNPNETKNIRRPGPAPNVIPL